MNRRRFLELGSLAALSPLAGCRHGHTAAPIAEIIDAHTHFYDPTRPQGVPWPAPDDAVLYRRVFPPEFERLTRPLGVTGTVVVEASPWLDDNAWLLELAAQHPALLGCVGNLKPGRPEFVAELQRFATNARFRGLRVGGDIVAVFPRDRAIREDLERVADRGLALDVLVGPDQLPAVATLAAAIPALRLVVDHCANVRVDGQAPPAFWLAGLAQCAALENVFVKVSGLVEGTGRTGGDAPDDLAFYRPTLDAVWNAFGPRRLIYGSNWPVSARFASYATVFRLVEAYFRERGPEAARRYFSANARWVYGLGAPRHRL